MICPRCDALLAEDTAFTASMARYGLPQRRYLCAMGHSVYVGLPVLDPPTPSGGAPVKLPNPSRTTERICPQCGDRFHGTKRQKYCGSACTRAAERERNQQRALHTGKRLEPAELQVARAIPRPWNSWKRNQTAPAAYADRPTGLSQKWV